MDRRQPGKAGLAAVFPIDRVLHGPRILLRRLTRGDAPAYLDLLEKNRLWVHPWMPEIPHPLSLQDLRKIIDCEHHEVNRSQRVDLGIFRATDASLIGRIALHSIQWGVSFSGGLGYWVAADQAGRGYMTEAVARLVCAVFEEAVLHRVWAGVQPANQPSQRVLEKLGFVREGLHRQELFINGLWQDQFFYTLLENEFQRARKFWAVKGWLAV
ncbi:MAG: GNAT family N-acetyltransferase [Candidatus Riflebacteria bacterium]|nr:GNAT family N-acetyltransferase [Candidatus Riflebacteria bacterium]